MSEQDKFECIYLCLAIACMLAIIAVVVLT